MLTAAYTAIPPSRSVRRLPSPPPPARCRSASRTSGCAAPTCTSCTATWTRASTTPLVFGHEMSGTIAALGDGVDRLGVGDPVTVMPLAWDGTCPACLAGTPHICQNLDFIGIDSPGALQALWNVPAETLVRAARRHSRSTPPRSSSRSPSRSTTCAARSSSAGREGRRHRRRPDRRADRDRRPRTSAPRSS